MFFLPLFDGSVTRTKNDLKAENPLVRSRDQTEEEGGRDKLKQNLTQVPWVPAPSTLSLYHLDNSYT